MDDGGNRDRRKGGWVAIRTPRSSPVPVHLPTTTTCSYGDDGGGDGDGGDDEDDTVRGSLGSTGTTASVAWPSARNSMKATASRVDPARW